MAEGAPNTAERMRERLRRELGGQTVVPTELLVALAEEREAQVARDIEKIAAELVSPHEDSVKWQSLLGRARDEARREPGSPVRFSPPSGAWLKVSYPNKTAEVVDLARQLISIPSVTNAPPGLERLDEVRRAATLIYDYASKLDLEVSIFEKGKYPAVLIGFPGAADAPVMLSGHFDVVEPEPDDSQFVPRVEGDYLVGRGAADMKTVAATYLVWMKDVRRGRNRFPGSSFSLSGTRKSARGNPRARRTFSRRSGGSPGFRLVFSSPASGPASGATSSRGKCASKTAGSSASRSRPTGSAATPAWPRRRATSRPGCSRPGTSLKECSNGMLTLGGQAGWKSQVRFPFIRVGETGVFNITASLGVLGIEDPAAPPGQRRAGRRARAVHTVRTMGFDLAIVAAENGVACSPENIYLKLFSMSVREATGARARPRTRSSPPPAPASPREARASSGARRASAPTPGTSGTIFRASSPIIAPSTPSAPASARPSPSK